MAYATTSQARAYYAGEEAQSLDVNVAMGVAARTVAAIAPPPLVITDEYEEAATHAELLVGKHIWNTDSGTISSAGLSGKTVSFTNSKEVRDIVVSAMGPFAGRVRSVPITRG